MAPGPMEIEQPQQATPDTPQEGSSIQQVLSLTTQDSVQDDEGDSASSPDSGTFKPPPST